MKASGVVLAVMSLSACGEGIERIGDPSTEVPVLESAQASAVEQPSPSPLPTSGSEYREIHSDASPLQRAIGLCELLVAYDAGAALYRVARITEVSEEPHSGLYIDLELLDPWSTNAPETPTVRVNGGEGADGVIVTSSVPGINARLGEELGVLLTAPTLENHGAYRLFNLGVFHDVGNGYTNGQLFARNPIPVAELGAAISAAAATAGSPDCPDRKPDGRPEGEPQDGPDQVEGPELIGSPG